MTQLIYIGNNTKFEVKDIDTYKLVLQDSQTLYLYKVLYALEIWQNLVSVFILLKLGYNLHFSYNSVKIYLGAVFYGFGFLLNDFMVLETLFYDCDNTINFLLFVTLSCMDLNTNI